MSFYNLVIAYYIHKHVDMKTLRQNTQNIALTFITLKLCRTQKTDLQQVMWSTDHRIEIYPISSKQPLLSFFVDCPIYSRMKTSVIFFGDFFFLPKRGNEHARFLKILAFYDPLKCFAFCICVFSYSDLLNINL